MQGIVELRQTIDGIYGYYLKRYAADPHPEFAAQEATQRMVGMYRNYTVEDQTALLRQELEDLNNTNRS